MAFLQFFAYILSKIYFYALIINSIIIITNHIIPMKKTVSALVCAIAATVSCSVAVQAATSEELASVLLTEKSLPITFTDDEVYPWAISKDSTFVQSSNNTRQTHAILTATFTIDKLSKFSYSRNLNYSGSYHDFRCNIDGVECDLTNSETNWGSRYTVLEPGTHTITWRYNRFDYSGTYYVGIKDVELSDAWIEVDVTTPGTLGVEVLYKVNTLQDVELLRVTGALNADDMASLKQMSNLCAADLSGATCGSIPASGFANMARLSTLILPEGVTSIGANAFESSNIQSINIPASVTSIGSRAFYASRLSEILFADNSSLTTICDYAFASCRWLREFEMPNSVTTLSYANNYYGEKNAYTFSDCTRLKRLVMSDAITYIPGYTCNNDKALTELHLPSNLQHIGERAFYNANALAELVLPENLRTIDTYAFYGLKSCQSVAIPLRATSLGNQAFASGSGITHVELPSNVSTYDNTFYDCPNIKTVVCRSATPPAIKNDPFPSLTKGDVTLKAPAFAVVNYKLDSYWYQFGNIEEMDAESDPGYWNISGSLMLTNNRRIEGTPDIDLGYGARLTVGGSAPMTLGTFNIYTSETNPSCILNTCEAFTADELNVYFSVSANTWYFITPMADIELADVTVSSTESFVFRYYDGASRAATGTGSSWRNVTEPTLKAGQGYIFQCNTAGVVKFPIAAAAQPQLLGIETADIALAENASDNAANAGWNYVGNPYPCYYDIYHLDFTAPITVWDSSSKTYKAYSITDDNYVLRPMQAFFVQKPDGVASIPMHAAGKQLSATITERPADAKTAAYGAKRSRLLFNMEITDGTLTDGTRVVLNDNASMTYETNCDAAKFMSLNNAVPQIYTIDTEGNSLAINERPLANGSVQLGVYIPLANTQYTLSASRSDGRLMLRDLLANTTTDLSAESYTFTSDMAGMIHDRFMIEIGYATPAGIDAVDVDAVTVTSAAGSVEVNAPAGTAISVYTAAGALVCGHTSTGDTIRMELPAGIYIVKAGEASYKTVVR